MNIYGDFQQNEIKSLKLKMKVGVIQEGCDNGWFFSLVLCSISHFSLAVLWAFWLFLSHLLYSFCSSPMIPLFVSSVFCLSCFQNFLPIFPLFCFSFPANVLIQTVIYIVLLIFSADCWLYKKQSRSRKCQSSCAWVSLWREQENSSWEHLLLCCQAWGAICTPHRAAGT